MFSDERISEIQSWLTHQKTLPDVEAFLKTEDDAIVARTGCSGDLIGTFDEYIRRHLISGDEIWLYDTGPESWQNLAGENGIALVRNGRVISFMMLGMN